MKKIIAVLLCAMLFGALCIPCVLADQGPALDGNGGVGSLSVTVKPGECATLDVTELAEYPDGYSFTWCYGDGPNGIVYWQDPFPGADGPTYTTPPLSESTFIVCLILDENHQDAMPYHTIWFTISVDYSVREDIIPNGPGWWDEPYPDWEAENINNFYFLEEFDDGFVVETIDCVYSVFVPYGETAVITAEPVGDDLTGVTYKWFGPDGYLMEGETSNQITSSEVTEVGWYYCYATDRFGFLIVAGFVVSVENHLSPVDYDNRSPTGDYLIAVGAKPGERVLLKADVAADEMDNMDYVWWWAGDMSREGEPLYGEHTDSYLTPPVEEPVTYCCYVTDMYGTQISIYFDIVPQDEGFAVTPAPTAVPTVSPAPTAAPTATPTPTPEPEPLTPPPVTPTPEPAVVPTLTPPPTVPDPEIIITENGKSAEVHGDVEELYVRIALILDSNGTSGLYVTQGEIVDGMVTVPNLVIPGLTVKGVNIALVRSIEDIPSRTPDAVATTSKYL